MIFIGGIHGVGKTYFCNQIKERLGIETYSSSTLIAERKKQPFAADKLIPDIDANQQYLLSAVDELKKYGKNFMLDGHFCLLNENGEITRITPETFKSLAPNGIIILTDSPETIAQRRQARDGIECTIESVSHFQDEEVTYAKEIAEQLTVDLLTAYGNQSLEDTIEFIKKH